jgi:hypothetical protein
MDFENTNILQENLQKFIGSHKEICKKISVIYENNTSTMNTNKVTLIN